MNGVVKMASRKMDAEGRQRIVDAYVAGVPVKDIAYAEDVSVTMVQRITAAAGVRTKGQGRRRPQTLRYSTDEAVALVEHLQSYSAAARVLGTDRSHLRTRLERDGRLVKVRGSNPLITGRAVPATVRDRAMDRYARLDGRVVDIAAEAGVHPHTVVKWAASEGLRRR